MTLISWNSASLYDIKFSGSGSIIEEDRYLILGHMIKSLSLFTCMISDWAYVPSIR